MVSTQANKYADRVALLIMIAIIGFIIGQLILLFSPIVAMGVIVIIGFILITVINYKLAIAVTIIAMAFNTKVPLGLIDFYIGEYLLIPLIIIGLLRGMKNSKISIDISEVTVLLFIISSIMSLMISTETEHALGSFRKIVAAIAFYLVLRLNINTKENIIFIINTIIVSAVFIGIIGMLQQFTGGIGFDGTVMNRGYLGLITSGYPNIVRMPNSTFASFNIYACYLDFIFPISLALSLVKTGRVKYAIASIIIFTALILSYSRGGIAAVIVGTIIVYCGNVVINKINKTYIIKMFALIVVMIALIIAIYSIVSNNAYNETLNYNVRLTIWQSALNGIKTNPLFGVGFSSSEKYLAYSNKGWGTHNNYVGIALSQGIIGLLAFISVIAAYTRLAYINIIKTSEYKIKILNLGFIAAIFSFLTHSLVDDSFTFLTFKVMLFTIFWAIYSLKYSYAYKP